MHCLGLCLLHGESQGGYSTLGEFSAKQTKQFYHSFLVSMGLDDQEYLAILMIQVVTCHFLSFRNIWNTYNYF